LLQLFLVCFCVLFFSHFWSIHTSLFHSFSCTKMERVRDYDFQNEIKFLHLDFFVVVICISWNAWGNKIEYDRLLFCSVPHGYEKYPMRSWQRQCLRNDLNTPTWWKRWSCKRTIGDWQNVK
jgi:hypothetical protein